MKRGDTLIEVLIAVAIFSIIAVSSIGIMNHGLNRTQAALETTMARTEIDSQAEALRFIHDSYANGKSSDTFGALWAEIVGRANAPDAHNYNEDVVDCSNAYSGDSSIFEKRAFVINPRELSTSLNNAGAIQNADPDEGIFVSASITPRIIYDDGDEAMYTNQVGSTNVSTVEGLWVVAVRSASMVEKEGVEVPQYYDFYIQTCWNTPGNKTATNLSTTIRLHNPDVVNNPLEDKDHYMIRYYDFDEDDNKKDYTQIGYYNYDKVTGGLYTIGTVSNGKSKIDKTEEYKFLGWSTDKTATTATYTEGQKITPGTPNMNLYAIWDKPVEFCLNLNYGNDGSIFYQNVYSKNSALNLVDKSECKKIYSSGGTIEISDPFVAYDKGYVYKGWTTGSSEEEAFKKSDAKTKFTLTSNCLAKSQEKKACPNNGLTWTWNGTDQRYELNVYGYWAADIESLNAVLMYPKEKAIWGCKREGHLIPVCVWWKKLYDAYVYTPSTREFAGYDPDHPLRDPESIRSSSAVAKLLYPNDDEGTGLAFEEVEEESGVEIDTSNYGLKHRIVKIKPNDSSFFGPIKEWFTKADQVGSVMYLNNLGYTDKYYYSIFAYNYEIVKFKGNEELKLAIKLKGLTDGVFPDFTINKSGFRCWNVFAIRTINGHKELVKINQTNDSKKDGHACASNTIDISGMRAL